MVGFLLPLSNHLAAPVFDRQGRSFVQRYSQVFAGLQRPGIQHVPVVPQYLNGHQYSLSSREMSQFFAIPTPEGFLPLSFSHFGTQTNNLNKAFFMLLFPL